MNITKLISKAIALEATDIHITAGASPIFRVNGLLGKLDGRALTPSDTEGLIKQALDEREFKILNEKGELDTSFSHIDLGRVRLNAFKQRGSYGMAMRLIPSTIPTMEYLGLPPIVTDLSRLPRGLILVTGPTGSGKTTTLASIIDLINRERACHILTLEDPIEYLHRHNRSIINQREVNSDTYSFADGLRAGLRQDPDVILVGEMRDLETISIALTAAETGHLVLSTLHTLGGAKTINRIIDVFPPHQQLQIRAQFASVIQGIISQQLLIKADETGRVAAFEVMVATPAVRNLIREDKAFQIDTVIETGANYGMQTMDSCLIDLYNKGLVTKDTVLKQAFEPELIKKYLV